MKLVIVDNYDSFTYNLVQMFLGLGLTIQVLRNDRADICRIRKLSPDFILISPGPKDPSQSGISMEVIHHFHPLVPILGVCLGLQCLNEYFGGRTVRADVPVHGKTSLVVHSKTGLLKNVPSPFLAARYHSLRVEPGRDSPLRITATSDDDVIMAMEHERLPLFGVQFHPESFLSEHGPTIIDNFMHLAGRPVLNA
jgi:anthranilate synthase component 2